MKVILCYPPRKDYVGYGQEKRWLPLGIASLGAYIRRERPDIEICLIDMFDYDYDKAMHELKKHIKPNDTNLIGFTCFTEQRFSVWEMCKRIKQALFMEDLRVQTVVGGAHAYLMSQQIIDNYPYVDFVVKGEGEKAWIKLIDYYNNFDKNEDIERIIEAENIKDLDSLPYALDGFDLFVNQVTELEAEAPIVFSRGCTDYCSFCSTTKFWKGYRSRSADNVFGEMLEYYKRYGTTKFKFHDDASTADIENWKKLCKLIAPYKWTYEITARADQFDDELIYLLSVSGCKSVALGIESGNEQLRLAMNKKLDIEKAKKNIKKLKKAGIEVILLFIIGYAGETDDTINETIDFIKEVKPTSWNAQPLMIFPGTKIYRDCIKLGWIDDNYWLHDVPQPYYIREQKYEKLNEWVEKILTCMRKKNILITAPIHENEEIFQMYLESLRNLKVTDDYNIYKLFILHNCEHLAKHITGKNEMFMTYDSDTKYKKDDVTHYWEDDNFKDVVAMKNHILGIVKENNFDYVFFVDSDLILHPNTLKQLLKADKDMVAEVFWTKWNGKGNEQPMPNAWRCDSYGFTDGFVETLQQKGLHRVGMTGACTLIKRKVIDAGVNWNPINNISFSNWEDRAFCIRVAVMGFEIWLDTNYPAFHVYRDSDITEGKRVLEGYKNG